MGAVAISRLTVEEYLAGELVAEEKSEYHDGELFPLDAGLTHSRIAAEFTYSLVGRLKGSSCRAAASLRVRASESHIVYPDLAELCGSAVYGEYRGDLSREVIVNPKVVIEILSPSTRDYDYGGKYMLYRGLPSVQEYILVEQKTPQIDLYRRTGGHWEIFTYEGLDALLPIESLNISIPLSEIYAG